MRDRGTMSRARGSESPAAAAASELPARAPVQLDTAYASRPDHSDRSAPSRHSSPSPSPSALEAIPRYSGGKERFALTQFVTQNGLPLLFAVVMLESFGFPLPGETALIAFGVLASRGHYSIDAVIATAAAAAIAGDNLGYWLIGRLGGRRLFQRWNWLNAYAERVLPRAEGLMERHGGKMVFFGRFVAVLRYTVAWIAGLGRSAAAWPA